MDSFSENIERFHDVIQSWSAPVWFSRGVAAPPESVNDNGSCGFFRYAEHRVMVTAHHVLKEYRRKKAETPETVFAVNIGDGNTVALESPTVLAEDETLDIATVAFPDLDQRRPHNKSYFPFDLWRPMRPKTGQLVSIIGFPSEWRRSFETFGAFEPVLIGMTISGVSDQRITLADEDDSVRFYHCGRLEETGLLAGGFSGSPAFVADFESINLVGVVQGGSDRLGCIGRPGQLFLSPTEYLSGDGTLDYLRMPPR